MKPDSKKTESSLREEGVLAFWNEKQIFQKSLDKEAPKGDFVFYDGPPFATGLPHYGHLLQSAIKDAMPRYKTMRGYRVERQWGWDCHGLPIENIVEKEIGSKSKKDIEAMGVKKFNDLCRAQIFTFIKEWETIIPRIGRWADMANPYRTMDFEYMQSEWWAFKTLFDKGLIYEDYRSMHICPRCETTLSQGEVAEGYKDVKDLSATVKFKVKNPERINLSGDVYLLAWTTTPWTLPGNVALAVGKEIEYAFVKSKDGEAYIFSEEALKTNNSIRFGELFSFQDKFNSKKGSELEGLEYEPLFDTYAKDTNLKNRDNGWKVYAADFVTTDAGTGIVHIAPAYGADDMQLGKSANLPFVQHVGIDGKFKSEMGEFAGLDLKPRAKDKPEEIREADLTIVKYLTEKGQVFESKKYEHSYPHCWRCDTALLNYATSSWFVAVEKIKPTLLETAKSVNWSPAHMKEGRFGQWLEGARDWSISRQRFWANTIPVWRCEACKKDRVFGNAAELEASSGNTITDLHRDHVDDVVVPCECGGSARRVPDVLDTWFDSGSVPYASLHYPLENQDRFKARQVADFIGEAQDQCRAWFYYQHVLAGGLFEKPAFKNVVATGLVLAEDGKKMSKKLKNYPDPVEIVEKYGADAMRLYMLSSPVVRAESLSFSEKEVGELSRKVFGRLDNVLSFYKLYANETPRDHRSDNVLDKWILSRLEEVVTGVTIGLEAYQLDTAMRPVADFVDDLSTWYLRRSRDRFKAADDTTPSASLQGPAESSAVPASTSPDSASPRLAAEAVSSAAATDKRQALATLRYVLHRFARVLAPATPFFAEYLFQAVREDEDEESVHLSVWPGVEQESPIDAELIKTMDMARAVVTLALEARAKAGIPVRQPLGQLQISNATTFADAVLDIIRDEVNVKSVLGSNALTEGVLLDTALTDELREEGMVREIVRATQAARKAAGLTPGQKANATVMAPLEIKAVAEKYRAEIIVAANLTVLMAVEGAELTVVLS